MPEPSPTLTTSPTSTPAPQPTTTPTTQPSPTAGEEPTPEPSPTAATSPTSTPTPQPTPTTQSSPTWAGEPTYTATAEPTITEDTASTPTPDATPTSTAEPTTGAGEPTPIPTPAAPSPPELPTATPAPEPTATPTQESLSAYELDFDHVDFGFIVPPASAHVLGDPIFLPGDERPTIRNVGTVALRLAVVFGPMADSTGAAITEEFGARFLGEERSLSAGEEVFFSSPLLPLSAAALDFWVQPPAGIPQGTYSGSLHVRAETEAGSSPTTEPTGTPTEVSEEESTPVPSATSDVLTQEPTPASPPPTLTSAAPPATSTATAPTAEPGQPHG
jgi:hypothetical protein